LGNESQRNDKAAGAIKASRTIPYLGMIFFLISELFLFGALFWTYYYLRGSTPVWPPAGVKLDLNLAVINTAILLISSGTMWFAQQSIRKGKEETVAFSLGATVVLGLTFLGITIFEWTHETFRPWTSAYGSIFYTLTGFHALHVFGGVLLISSMLARTLRHRFSSQIYLPLEISSLYWHYVDTIWLIVFATLFIVR